MAERESKIKWNNNYDDQELKDRWNGLMLYHSFSKDNIMEYFNIFMHDSFEDFFSQYLNWHPYRKGYRMDKDKYIINLKKKVAGVYEECQYGRIENYLL